MQIPQIEDSVLVLIDVQEKFVPAIPALKDSLPRMELLLDAASVIGLDVIVTEQYPKGLGPTVETLKSRFNERWPVIEKMSFSCFGSTEFRRELESRKRNNIILSGIETHVCVQQTAIDAINKNYQVFLVSDTVASRKESERETALELMRNEGVKITTTESVLLLLLRSSEHPKFREISKLIK